MAVFHYDIYKDGPATILNYNLWPKYERYIQSCIEKSPWIYTKSFLEPVDIIIATRDVLELLPNVPNDIDFLIKKIRSEVQKQWIKYLRSNDPGGYNHVLEKRRENYNNNKERFLSTRKKYLLNPETKNSYNAYHNNYSKKERLAVKEAYILNIIQKEFYRKGISLSFEDIKKDYSAIIVSRRKALLSNRLIREIRTLVGKNIKYGLSEFTVLSIKSVRNCNYIKLFVDDRSDPMTIKIEDIPEFIDYSVILK